MLRHQIQKVWVDNQAVYARTHDGLTAHYPFARWRRLASATADQRADFYLTYTGIHWPQIDEDLSFEGMFSAMNLCDRTPSEDSVFWEECGCVAEDE